MKSTLLAALAVTLLSACASANTRASTADVAAESPVAEDATRRLADIVGRYALSDGPELQVFEREGQLLGRMGGNDPTVLEPLSGRTFQPAADPEARVTFEPAQGRAERVEVVMAGVRMQGLRIASPQDAVVGSLDDKLAALDARLFDAAFVACDMVQVRGMLAEDIEFVHDLSGLRQREEVIADFERLTADCPALKGVRRELVQGSLRTFPIAQFGALQTGEHRFVEAGADTYTAARFSTLWRREGQVWKVARVLSYDHRPIPIAAEADAR